MRADQLRLSAYEVHVLRSVLRDWRQFHLNHAGGIPARDLDQLEDRLDRVDIDAAEARSRSGASPFDLGLGAPGDLPHVSHAVMTHDRT